MGTQSYLEYLDSPEWWQIRRTAMRRANWRCEREKPGDSRHEGTLDVHHRTYENLGHERLDDVEVLCRACHQAEHIPRNMKKRELERYGQERLFQRWPAERDDLDLPLEAA